VGSRRAADQIRATTTT